MNLRQIKKNIAKRKNIPLSKEDQLLRKLEEEFLFCKKGARK